MPPAARKPIQKLTEAAELRSRAEARFQEHTGQGSPDETGVDTLRLLHELQVHQIELEMQNAELQQARAEVEAGLERYTDLYDFAPVGYFSMTQDGTVRQANLYGAKLLGIERSQLVGKRFGLFILDGERESFNTFLENVFEKKGSQTCEVTLCKEENGDCQPIRPNYNGKYTPLVSVQIDATVSKKEDECRAVVIDITRRKRDEESLRYLVSQNVQRAEELEAITRVSASMRQAKSLDEFLPLLVVHTIQALKSQAGILALLKDQKLEFAGGVGKFGYLNGKALADGGDPLWGVVHSGEFMFLDKLFPAKQADAGNSFFERLTRGLRVCIAAPIKKGNVTIGLLILGYSTPFDFSVGERRLLAAISDMAGSALQRMSATETIERMAAQRNQELESIFRITSAASESIDLNSALKRALGFLLEGVNASSGAIYLVNEDIHQIELLVDEGMPDEIRQKKLYQSLENSPEGLVYREKKSLLFPNSNPSIGLDWTVPIDEGQVYAGIPMQVLDRVIGVMSITRMGLRPFDLEEMTLLSFLAHHLGLIVENIHLFKAKEHRVLLEERSRMARELHDSIIQILFSAGLFSKSAQDAILKGDLENAGANLQQSSLLMQQALIDMRLMVYELRPQPLETKGLIAALKVRLDAVEKRAGIQVVFLNDELPFLNYRFEDGLYRVIIEACNNAYKHAHAKHLSIEIKFSGDTIRIVIEDDGVGFDPAEAVQGGGMGISILRERVQILRGEVEIQSARGKGTRISISLPFEK